MTSRKRHSPQKQGIEQRTDSKGVTRYRGTAYDRRSRTVRRGPWERSLPAARSWRLDAQRRIARGGLAAGRVTVAESVEMFLAGIEDGSIPNRSGRPFKPSVVRDYRRDLELRVVPQIGNSFLAEVGVVDVQRLVDFLRRHGSIDGGSLSGSTVRNTIMALRSLCAWAIPRGHAHTNPCAGVRLPTDGQKRERIATPREAALLVGVLEGRDRTAFALATYAGLRAGELLALDWSAVDLDLRALRVERGWDHGAGKFIAAKSDAAERVVPITERLNAVLADHRATFGGEGLLLPNMRRIDPSTPMSHSALSKRLQARWKASGLEPLGLHEARHTFASMLIAANVNAKAITTYMGHASIQVTFDRYGHLMPGDEAQMLKLLDGYLERT